VKVIWFITEGLAGRVGFSNFEEREEMQGLRV
jgi:hypothetical protein